MGKIINVKLKSASLHRWYLANSAELSLQTELNRLKLDLVRTAGCLSRLQFIHLDTYMDWLSLSK